MNPSGIEKLSLSSIRSLDHGIIDAAFQQEVNRCVKDCQDREGLDKDRTVAVVFRFRPKCDKKAGTFDGDTIICDAQIYSSLPKRVTQLYTMKAKADGSLIFRAEDPDDPNNPHLFDEIDKETGEVKPRQHRDHDAD